MTVPCGTCAGSFEIAETLYYQWRGRLLEGGNAALANPRESTAEHTEIAELKRKVGQLERALGRKTCELEIAGNSRGTGPECPGGQIPRSGS